MGTVWIHDSFHDDPRVIAARPSALALWLRAAAYSARYGTAGNLTPPMVKYLRAPKRDREHLVEIGLWERVEGGGYRMVPSRLFRLNTYTPASRWDRARKRQAATVADSAPTKTVRGNQGKRGSTR